MNTFDIATAAATRPADRAAQVENQILNAFKKSLADIRREYALQDGEHVLPVEFAHTRHRLTARQQALEIARVVAELNGAGIDNYVPRTIPDGFFHTVDPLVSFLTCSTCDGSVVYDPPCHFGDEANRGAGFEYPAGAR